MCYIKSIGSAGATFATVACLSASVRDKDDYVNATIGGALSGSIFGLACKWIKIQWGILVKAIVA